MTDRILVLDDRHIGFIGRLGAMSRKEAATLIRQHGGHVTERVSAETNMVVIGAEHLPEQNVNELLTRDVRERIQRGEASLIHEHEFWQQLGLVDSNNSTQLYTPAMVAGLLKTSVSNIRRWYRMGLLEATKVAHRLPYFDFQQVQNAKQLYQWIRRGAKATDIKKQLRHFEPWIANRSLAELNVVVDGRRILLRRPGQLLGAHGQLHLDFDEPSSDADDLGSLSISEALPSNSPTAVPSWKSSDLEQLSREDVIQIVDDLEEAGDFEQAIEWYRVLLARFGLNAEVSFQLAELLYRTGDVHGARERYYVAIEIDEDFVEARANLGCVLAELGQLDLAAAAFEGALLRDDHYPDVHYHLARCLDELGRSEQATQHWLRFLQLSPQSPWADEALDRLGKI